jgi:hypothetical protein
MSGRDGYPGLQDGAWAVSVKETISDLLGMEFLYSSTEQDVNEGLLPLSANLILTVKQKIIVSTFFSWS